MKPIVTKTLTASGSWLTARAKDLCRKLLKGSAKFSSQKQVIDGYLLEAKRVGDRSSVNVLDFPAYLVQIGRFYPGTSNPGLYLVQTLPLGRDSYLPGALREVQDPSLDPTILAGYYARTTIQATTDGNEYAPTRYWGAAAPFTGVGAMHTYHGLISNEIRWPMAYADPDSEFVWRLVTIAPSIVRYVDGVPTPKISNSPVALWTIDIAESVLDAVGAKAITRLQDEPQQGFELNWEAAQYPWSMIGQPATYTDDDGNYGFRVTIAAQVVYDEAGPYYFFAREDHQGTLGGVWSEVSSDFAVIGGVPSGARGLWAADVQWIKGEATITNHYRVFGGDSGDTRRQPLLRDRTRLLPDGYNGGQWYMNNIVYRAPMATVVDEQGNRTSIMVCATFVNTTVDSFDSNPAYATEFKGYLFLDIHWFGSGSHRTQNLRTTQLKRGIFYPQHITPPYNGANSAWDLGDANEGRFTIGADTDGTEVVFPVFSGFAPDSRPLLTIYVANESGVTQAYSGVPGFTMCMPVGTGEQAIFNYGVVDPADSPTGNNTYGRWITMPAGCDQVTYIGNSRYAFYVSSQINEPGENNYLFSPKGNLAVAIFSTKDNSLQVAGVIDSTMKSNGFGSDVDIGEITAYQYADAAYTVPVFASPPKLGRIEVVRVESDGYDPNDTDAGGHPATLIASSGHGQPGYNIGTYDGEDIRMGTTWISYDSGGTWTTILNYGSPTGTYHCGSELAPRSDPIVRI